MRECQSPPVESEPLNVVERAREGDQEAWGQLYRDHRRLVRGLARKTFSNPHDAEQLEQEVWTRAVEGIGTLKNCRPASFRAWLCSILRRTSLDLLKRTKLKRRVFTRDSYEGIEPFTEDSAPLDELIETEEIQRVRRAMQDMGEMHRRMVEMYYFEGQTCDQIASTEEKSQSTISARLDAARKKLKKELMSPTATTPPASSDLP